MYKRQFVNYSLNLHPIAIQKNKNHLISKKVLVREDNYQLTQRKTHVAIRNNKSNTDTDFMQPYQRELRVLVSIIINFTPDTNDYEKIIKNSKLKPTVREVFVNEMFVVTG